MIIAIVGPTGIGKTALSIELAKHYKAEIINFDSMQVYEYLDIGTAKVTEQETEGIPHHLLSFVPLDRTYTVYDFQKDARKIMEKLQKQGKNIILVGGTGLYLKATLYDYVFQKGTQNNNFSEYTNEELINKIRKYQVEDIPHVNNRKRLVRLLNRLENNETITKNGNQLLYSAHFIGLTCDREVLYKRLNKRVDMMFDMGLVNEVEKVKKYFSVSKALQTGIGYKEFLPYYDGKVTLDEVKEEIKKNSRHYAKRQYTFFRHQFDVTWFESDFKDFNKTIRQVIDSLEKS